MNALLVEDDEQKRKTLEAFINEILQPDQLMVRKSYQSALSTLKETFVDLVILDMSLPTFDIGAGEDGGRRLPYGGKEILRQLKRKSIQTKVIVVTQFDVFGEGNTVVTREELDDELNDEYPDLYVGMVYYSVATGTWKEELVERIVSLEKDGRSE